MPRPKTSSLGLVIPKPAARPVSPFMGPGPLQRSAVEDAAAALTAFAPRLQDYQGALAEQHRRDVEAKASAEFEPIVSTLVGKSPEEQEKAYAEAVSKGLIQQQEEGAQKARATMWGAGDAQWVWSQMMLDAANDKFTGYTDPETNEYVEGVDPAARMNELKAQALKSYGATRGGADWSKSFSSAMASYQRDIDFQILKIKAANDHSNTVKSAVQGFSVQIPRLGELLIPKEDDQDKEAIGRVLTAIKTEYDLAKETNEGTWARDVTGALVESLNAHLTITQDYGETLDIFETVMLTAVGKKTLGQIEQVRLMTSELQRTLIAGERTDQDREDREEDRGNIRAGNRMMNDLASLDARLRGEGVGPAGRKAQREAFFQATLSELPEEDRGAAARAGLNYNAALDQDIGETPTAAAEISRMIDNAQTDEELLIAEAELKQARDSLRITKSHDSLKDRIDAKRDPLRVLQTSQSYKEVRSLNDSVQKDDFPYLADDDGRSIRDRAMTATLEAQKQMEGLVENGTVNEGAVHEQLMAFRKKEKELRDEARANEDEVTKAKMELVAAGAEGPEVVNRLRGKASTKFIDAVSKEALAMRNHHDTLIYSSEPSPDFSAALQEATIQLALEVDNPQDIQDYLNIWQGRLEVAREEVRGAGLSVPILRVSDDAVADELRAAVKIAPTAQEVEGEEPPPLPQVLSDRSKSKLASQTAASMVLSDEDNALTFTSQEHYANAWKRDVSSEGIPDGIQTDLAGATGNRFGIFMDTWSMASARERSENKLLLYIGEERLSKKATAAAVAVTYGVMGVTIDEWVNGKKTLSYRDHYPPFIRPFGKEVESMEVTYRPTSLLSSTTPIIGLVEATREAMATSGANVEAAQEAWMRAHEPELDKLAKLYDMNETEYDIFKSNQKNLSKKQAPY